MKFLIIAFVSIFALAAGATSLQVGPYAYMQIGDQTCYASPDEKVDSTTLQEWIAESAQHTFGRTALHMRATVPAIKIVAGIFPDLQPFTIFEDSSAIFQRSGAQAQRLVDFVKAKCVDR